MNFASKQAKFTPKLCCVVSLPWTSSRVTKILPLCGNDTSNLDIEIHCRTHVWGEVDKNFDTSVLSRFLPKRSKNSAKTLCCMVSVLWTSSRVTKVLPLCGNNTSNLDIEIHCRTHVWGEVDKNFDASVLSRFLPKRSKNSAKTLCCMVSVPWTSSRVTKVLPLCGNDFFQLGCQDYPNYSHYINEMTPNLSN